LILLEKTSNEKLKVEEVRQNMIFWIFVILTVLGIAVIAGVGKIDKKYSYKEEDNTKLVNFFYHNDEPIIWTSGIVAVLNGFVVAFMIVAIIVNQVSADGLRAKNEQRYNALIYKVQTESIRDEFGIVNKEYIDEVQSWNEDVVKYQTYSQSFWIGIFYPDRAYDGFETINLEDIKMRD